MASYSCDTLPFNSVQNPGPKSDIAGNHSNTCVFFRFSSAITLDDPRFKHTKFDVSLTCLTGIGNFELWQPRFGALCSFNKPVHSEKSQKLNMSNLKICLGIKLIYQFQWAHSLNTCQRSPRRLRQTIVCETPMKIMAPVHINIAIYPEILRKSPTQWWCHDVHCYHGSTTKFKFWVPKNMTHA